VRLPQMPTAGVSGRRWYWASAENDPPLDKFSRTWRAYPELLLLDRAHFVPGLVLGGTLATMGGADALLWGFVVPVPPRPTAAPDRRCLPVAQPPTVPCGERRAGRGGAVPAARLTT
jgi:hypothetical protein